MEWWLFFETTETYSERVEALLARGIPNLVSQDTIFQTTFLGQECSTDGWFLVRLKLIGDLVEG